LGSGPPTTERKELVKEEDRERYRAEVASLGRRLEGADEQTVWEVYATTEKLIAVLKLRLDYETPGVFTKLPDASDPAKLVKDASELLASAAEQIAEGKLVDSIGTLRKARNDLRSYLTERKRSAASAQRGARSRPSV
jgi:hypothetical protein